MPPEGPGEVTDPVSVESPETEGAASEETGLEALFDSPAADTAAMKFEDGGSQFEGPSLEALFAEDGAEDRADEGEAWAAAAPVAGDAFADLEDGDAATLDAGPGDDEAVAEAVPSEGPGEVLDPESVESPETDDVASVETGLQALFDSPAAETAATQFDDGGSDFEGPSLEALVEEDGAEDRVDEGEAWAADAPVAGDAFADLEDENAAALDAEPEDDEAAAEPTAMAEEEVPPAEAVAAELDPAEVMEVLRGEAPVDGEPVPIEEFELEDLDPDAPESVLEAKDFTGRFRAVAPEDLPKAPEPEVVAASVASADQFLKTTDEIARLSESIEQMRTELVERVGEAKEGDDSAAETMDRLNAILSEFQTIRDEVATTQRSAEKSIDLAESARQRFQEVHDRLAKIPVPGAPIPLRRRGGPQRDLPLFDAPFVLLAIGVILMSWAITVYVRTGDGRTTLLAIMAANLTASCMLIHSRTGRFF